MNLCCFHGDKKHLQKVHIKTGLRWRQLKSDFWIIQQENPSVALLGRFLWSFVTTPDICFYLIFASHLQLQLVKICGVNSQVPQAIKGWNAAVAPPPQGQSKAGRKRWRDGEGKDIKSYLYRVVKVMEEGRSLKAGNDCFWRGRC